MLRSDGLPKPKKYSSSGRQMIFQYAKKTNRIFFSTKLNVIKIFCNKTQLQSHLFLVMNRFHENIFILGYQRV